MNFFEKKLRLFKIHYYTFSKSRIEKLSFCHYCRLYLERDLFMDCTKEEFSRLSDKKYYLCKNFHMINIKDFDFLERDILPCGNCYIFEHGVEI